MTPKRISLMVLLVVTACAHHKRVVHVFMDCNSQGYCRESARVTTNLVDVPLDEEWPSYGRTPYGDRHSPLKQITPQNVSKLEVAWRFHTGEGAPEFKHRAPTATAARP